jgi:tetrahydromethanopterin S-methyltransferase subunit E
MFTKVLILKFSLEIVKAIVVGVTVAGCVRYVYGPWPGASHADKSGDKS